MLVHRSLRAFPAKGYTVTGGQGVWLETDQGPMMDLGGASHGTALIGHDHPAVRAGIETTPLTHVNANVPHPSRDTFLDALHERLPDRFTQTFLANSGTEAVECALKLAIANGRSEIVAIEGGFHGRTMGALSVTSREAFRAPFAARLAPTRFVRPDDIDALHAAVTDATAAIILEPILGEGGVIPLSPGFLQAARDLCDQHGALLIADEVQTGFRTGTTLASGDLADIVTLGKGLAGGLPIGACVVTADVAARLPPGGHGSTYGGGPFVCTAGSATLGSIDTEAATRIEARFRQRLADLHPAIAGLRGRGAMLAIELRMRATDVLAAWEREGVTALPAGPRAIRILPPLTITDAEIDDACERLLRALP